MANQTDLLNDALSQIGEARITAIDDGSRNANYCQTFYPPLRDAVLRSHHWNFATARASLAADAATPAFQYNFQFALPADCLKIREFYGDLTVPAFFDVVGNLYPGNMTPPYTIEGRMLLTNSSLALIVYTFREENPDKWDAICYQTIAMMLASKLASAITKDERRSATLLEKANAIWLPIAMAVDGQEGTVLPFIANDLTWGR